MHPVGPLPAATYWRRRGLLLLTLLVLLLVARSCASGGSPSPAAGRSTPRPTPTPTVATPSSPAPTRAAVSPAPAKTTAPAAVGLCPDAALSLTTSTDSDTYALGATPKITMVVKNTSAAPCRRDLGAGVVELLVTSGSDRIWSSDDCSPSKASALTTLAPGATQAIVKTWPGVRSRPGCQGAKETAKAGTYRVAGRVGALRVDGAVFRLRG